MSNPNQPPTNWRQLTGSPPALRIHFHTPVGVPVQFDETVEMPAVPREGDTIHFDEEEQYSYRIHHVVWTPHEPDWHAYVVLR